MPAANFDPLHIKLSRLIQDPVAAATADGVITSALRTDYLNRANDYIKNMFVGAYRSSGIEKQRQLETLIQGLIASNTASTSGGSKALPTDYYTWLTAAKVSGGGRMYWTEPSRKDELDTAANPNEGLTFTVFGGTVYMYDNGSAITNGAHPFRYIKADQGVADTTDIGIDRIWWEPMLYLAAGFYYSEKGELQMATNLMQIALTMIRSILMV